MLWEQQPNQSFEHRIIDQNDSEKALQNENKINIQDQSNSSKRTRSVIERHTYKKD